MSDLIECFIYLHVSSHYSIKWSHQSLEAVTVKAHKATVGFAYNIGGARLVFEE